MATHCLNCGTEVSDQFCPHCGQKKTVQKLTWTSLVEEIIHFFSHIEHSFLRTSFQLLIRPGRVIKAYLAGQRKTYHKPVALYLIWTTIRLLTFEVVKQLNHYENLRTGSALLGSSEGGMYVVKHNQAFGLLLVPIESLCVWLITTRPRMNYVETLTTSIYLSAIVEMLIAVQIFMTGLVFRTNFLTNGFVIQVEIVYFAWLLFALFNVFWNDKITLFAVRAFLSLAIAFLIFQITAVKLADLILYWKR